MNSLLKRQISKFLQPEQLKDLKQFLKAVNDSYDNYEDQISMSQRAMKISSDELFEANLKLRKESSSLKDINRNLSAILSSMNLDSEELQDEKEFSKANYVKKQASEIVAINRQREELLKNLELQNEELNDYAHVVSHDLKAPLRNIDTLVNWVIEENIDSMQPGCLKSLNLVLYNVEKMDLLIKGILDYSTIDKLDSDDRNVNFNILIDDVLRGILIPSNIEISVQENLPSLYGNAWRFKQVFQNLIQNAVTYCDKEAGNVEIGLEQKENHFMFFVKDNGIGIDPTYFDRIFKIFTKLESNSASSGIGLSIVKKIVNFYEGEVWCESKPNKGSTFFITFPKKIYAGDV